MSSAPAGGSLLVRGGTLVDGTGRPAFRADVRVRGGRVAEVGPDLRPDGEPVIDAGGAYVTPGFVESHSHFDGSMWWDPSCDPMPAYGTTTAIIGNCGLTVAPLAASARRSMIELFCFIEDLPVPAFEQAVPWSWETWPEYRAAALASPAAINVGVFVGHQALRTYVMGDEAWTRHASDAERARMAGFLDEALTTGALGFSTTFMDTDRENREVPSRHADDAEFDALLAVVARHPGATLQFVPRFLQPEHWADDFDRLAALCARHAVRANWAVLRCESRNHDERVERRAYAERWRARGADMWATFSGAPSYVNLHFDRSIMWHGVRAWHELVNGANDVKETLLASPEWRARARADWDACTYTLVPIRRPESLVLHHSARGLEGRVGHSLADEAAARGLHLSDALADWLLENGIGSSLRTADQPMEEDAVVELVRDPCTVTGVSDAGAHIQMFNGAGNPTYMLTRYVRDTGLLTIEETVHAVTGKHARCFGLGDRGVVAVGRAADLTVFALDEIDLQPDERVDDVPGGSWRYTRRPGGYRATIVNGVPTFADGRPTGARPGTFVAAGPGPS
ncbi:MAG TPA: amidohydrolase family protein [Acidimicrobiia bacterium]|nr:amidohydrolase family protein [Acidimicrobiia bacterium]